MKAETVKLHSTGLSGGGDVSYADGKLTWTATGNNVLTAISFEAGVLPYFDKIKLSCSDLTEGASFRVIVVTKNNNNDDVNFVKSFTSTGEGDIEISLSELKYQFGSDAMTDEEIARAYQLRIGGGAGTVPASLTINPTTICLETSWEAPMEIGSTADWSGFSLLVKNGLPSLNATMTADVDAGSTMVGTSSKPYQGTFDGAGHTLTFTYDGSTLNEIAPFQYINNATINNLTTAGSINAQNIFGGIVGTAGGASTLNYCTSNMVLTANHNGDTNNGRVAGLVGRCADNATPAGTSITFNNCMFVGSISSTQSDRCCGLVSWARSTTVTANNCLIAPTSVTNGTQNIAATGGTDPVVTPTNCYYTKKFGWSDQGTLATTAQIESGELCYTLNENAIPSTPYFFGQNLKAVSSSPILTSNTAYKVYSLGGGEYANWTNTINDDIDWVTFSKLVAAGETDMDVTMTADVDAGSTMVGDNIDGKRYQGTFDGAGHTLTFTYTGSDTEVGPFKCVQAATFKDLHVTGAITSSGQLIAGLVGRNRGATTITRCISSVNLTTDNGDSRPGGFVGRSSEDDANITFSYCVYDGNITATKQACGFVGWAAEQTMNVSHCLVASTSVSGTEGAANFIGGYGTKNISDSYYLTQFGTSTEGTLLNDQLRYSGQAAYNLNQGIGDGAWFFGQGNLNSSIVDDLPTLTNDASKKVWGKTPEYTGTMVYMNAGGAVPNAVRLKALGWYFDGVESHVVNTVPADINDETVLRRTLNYFTLKVGAAGATTLVVPFTTTRLPENVKAYNLSFDGSVVNAEEVDHLTANKPVLINAPEGEYLFSAGKGKTGLTGLTLETGDNAWIAYSAGPTNGALTGIYNCISGDYTSVSFVPTGAYVLQNGAEGLGFYRVTDEDPIKITSFRAYLTAPVSARSLRIVYPDDETTGISATLNDNGKMRNDRVVYNLNGQRVEKATKGLYIKNGKKVMIK